MTHVLHRQVPTRWTSDEVFAYLLDFSRAEERDSGTVRCEGASGDGGVSTRYRNVSKFLRRETKLDYTTERVDAWRRTFTVAGGKRSVTSTDTVTMTRQRRAAWVDYRAELDFSGRARLLAPPLALLLKKLGDDTAAQLGRVLDAKAAA